MGRRLSLAIVATLTAFLGLAGAGIAGTAAVPSGGITGTLGTGFIAAPAIGHATNPLIIHFTSHR